MRTKLDHYSDVELLQRYHHQPHPELIGELYRRYSMLVYGLAYKYLKDDMEAQDAVTEIFEHIMKRMPSHEVTFFRSWLFVVAKNYLVRKKSKINPLETIDIEKISGKFMENEPNMYLNIQEHEREHLQQAMSSLNEEQRTCIELFYYQQKSYQEVASITGYELNKVKSFIQNGKRNLKLFIEEKRQQHG